MELIQGHRLNDRFKVIGSLGEADNGRLLLVQDNQKQDQKFALKLHQTNIIESNELQERYNERVKKFLNIKHENIINAIELVDEGTVQGLLMEFVDGNN